MEDVAPKLKHNTMWRNRLKLKAQHKIRIGKTLYTYFKAIYGLMPKNQPKTELLTNKEDTERQRKLL